MDIPIPYSLNFSDSIEFCELLDTLPEDDKYIFDYKNLGLVEPFGMLLVSSKIRQFMKNRGKAEFFDRSYKTHSYAANMGYFKSVYQDYGKEPGELSGNISYIPISYLEATNIHREARKRSEHVVVSIERESKKLAKVLSNGEKKLTEVLTYSIREIIRNVFEHSQSDRVWYAGQYWPTKDRVEICILDEGVGIQHSLRKNPKLTINSDSDSLLLALEPGISGKYKKSDPDDPFANSGYGLFMTSRICRLGGNFIICSGNSIFATNSKYSRFFTSSFSGTAIRMRLKVSQMPELKNVLSDLRDEGEIIAHKNRKHSILSASKVSSLLSTVVE